MIDFLKDNFLYITALVTGFKWVYEYSNKLKWERNKFLLDRLEIFFKDENTKNIQLILDWNKIKINYENQQYIITDEILLEALKTHDEKHSFNPTEKILRGAFDEYFDKLTEFLILVESGMISEKNFYNFMRYWIEIMNGKKRSKSKKIVDQFLKYLDFYGYDKLKYFLLKDPKKITLQSFFKY